MNKVIAFGFSTYESLLQKLRSVDNPTNLLRIYEENKEQFRQDHLVLSLRILGKFCRQINPDNQFSEITGKLNDIVGKLTENEIVDVLFWLRKFRLSRIPLNITSQTQNYLFQLVQQMTEKQMLSFSNMCSIYNEFSILNHHNETLAKSISEQILTQKQLSPFHIIQLLSSIVIKINHCNLNKDDYLVLTNSIKLLDSQLDNFDLEQKSEIFKICAEVQFQNLPPKFQVPIELKKIKDQLKNKVNLLQEEVALNIFKAYEYLPKYFDFDLLGNLKDETLNTLNESPQNLNDKFIIQIAERMIKLSHKLNYDIIRKVLMEICNRIQNKTMDLQLLDQFIPNLMKYKKIDEVTQALQQLENKSIIVQKYLFINGINMKVFLDDFIQKNGVKQIPLDLAITYLIFSNRDSKEHLDMFLRICREYIQNHPLKTLKAFKENQLNYSLKYQIQEEAYLNLIEQVKQQKFDFLQICKDLISGCCTAKCKNALLKLYDQQNGQINPKQIIYRMTQSFDSYDYESFSAFSLILLKDPSKIPIVKFVDYLTLNQQQLQELIKSDYIQQATKVIISAYQAQPEQKLYSIVNFAIRFEMVGYHSEHISIALNKIAQNFKKNYPTSPYPDPLFVNLLMSYNLLSPEDAIIQLNNEKTYQNTKIQFYGIILSSQNIPPNISELSDQIKVDSLKALQKEITYQPIYNLITLGNLSTEEALDIKIKLQSLYHKLQIKQYFELIMSAKDESILKDLSHYFHQFSPKLGIDRIIIAVKKFAKFQVKTQTVYNALLETYGYSFYNVFNEQRIQILEIFALAKIKQVDIFKKTLEKIKQQASTYKIYYNNIIEIVTDLGFIEKEFVHLINQIVEKNQISSQVALKLMQYYVLTDQPIQDIEKLVTSFDDIKNKVNYKTALVYEILLRKYPNSIATKAHEIFINEDKMKKLRQNLANSNKKTFFKNQLCFKYLQLLGIQTEINRQIDGINVELYLPSIQTSLLVVSQLQLNFDQISLNGVGIFEKKLLEVVTKKVIIINFKQFLKLDSHQDRATFLMNLGIPINVDINQIDFSSISISESNDKGKNLKTSHKNQAEIKDLDDYQ